MPFQFTWRVRAWFRLSAWLRSLGNVLVSRSLDHGVAQLAHGVYPATFTGQSPIPGIPSRVEAVDLNRAFTV